MDSRSITSIESIDGFLESNFMFKQSSDECSSPAFDISTFGVGAVVSISMTSISGRNCFLESNLMFVQVQDGSDSPAFSISTFGVRTLVSRSITSIESIDWFLDSDFRFELQSVGRAFKHYCFVFLYSHPAGVQGQIDG